MYKVKEFFMAKLQKAIFIKRFASFEWAKFIIRMKSFANWASFIKKI